MIGPSTRTRPTMASIEKDAVERMSKTRPVYENEVMPDICG